MTGDFLLNVYDMATKLGIVRVYPPLIYMAVETALVYCLHTCITGIQLVLSHGAWLLIFPMKYNASIGSTLFSCTI